MVVPALVRRAAALALTLSISLQAAAQTVGPLGGQAAEGGASGAAAGAVNPTVVTSSPKNAGPTLQTLALPHSTVVAPVIVALKAGANDYIVKPVHPVDLGRKLAKFLPAGTKPA